MSFDLFWRSTPHEVERFITAQVKAKEDDYKQMISAAYLQASLARAKRMPPLDDILKKVGRRKRRKPQSQAEQIKSAQNITSIVGNKAEGRS